MKRTLCRYVFTVFLSAIGLPAVAAVSGIEGPWSILVAGTVPSRVAEGHFVPLLVSSLDGETPVSLSTATKPGKKQLLLDTPRAEDDLAPSHKQMELDMVPCMRYYVAGKKSAAASRRWTPEIYRVEPIGECVAKYKPGTSTQTPPLQQDAPAK